MSNLGQTLLIPARSSSGWTPGTPVRNNVVTAVGDSITASSASASGGTIPIALFATNGYSRYQAQLANASPVGGYLTWAAIVPKTGDTSGNGKLRWGGVHATVNFRTDQVLATHIQGVDSPLNDERKAGTCVVMAGSNDLAQICPSGTIVQAELDEAIANLRAICVAIMGWNIMPALCWVPPNNTANNKIALASLNPLIVTLGASLGIPVIDTHTPVADGANGWGATMHQGDGIHPSVLGAKTMGIAIRDGLDSYLPAVFPTMATTATDDTAAYLYKNGSFTDDGGTPDGVPDGGQTQSTTYWTKTTFGTAWTLGARAGYNGQAMRWNKTTDTGTCQLQSTGAGSAVPLGLDGRRIAWGFRTEIASWAASTQLLFEAWKILDSTIKPFRLNLITDAAFTTAIDPFIWYQDWLIPSGFDDADGGKIRTNISAAGTGTNTIDAYIGQFTLRDEG